MKMDLKHRLVALALAVGLVAATPAAALAGSDTTDATDTTTAATDTTQVSDARPGVDALRERVIAGIDARLRTLERLTNAVTGNEHVTPRHEATLLADYADATASLARLRAQAVEAETVEELLRIAHSVVVDHRIYLVVAPKTREVIVSDTVADAVERFGEIADRLAEAIARAEEAGYDVTEARRWLTVARDEIAEADRAGTPVAGMVIGLQPEDWPDPARSQLESGRRRLHDAHLDLREAKVALEKSHQALKDAVGDEGGTDDGGA